MRLTRHYPKDYESLRSLVHEAVEGSDSVVMQAGHFLLYYDAVSKEIIPCIENSLNEERHKAIKEEYAYFPILTWKLGLRLLSSLDIPQKQVMTVVNDWQYLPKDLDRSTFYSSHSKLPNAYIQELETYHGDITLLEPTPVKTGTSTAPFFGEMNLRNRSQRHVGKLIKKDQLPSSAVVKNANKTLSLPDLAGVQREVYCSGKTGDCAAEIAEMIHEASSITGATCFINLYPLVCRDYVELGSQFANELLGANCTTVLNLGFQSTAIRDAHLMIQTTEATIHKI